MSTTIHLTALRHSAFYTPYLLTIAGDFLKQQGLEPVYEPIKPGQSAEQLLIDGDCHVSQSAVATSFAVLDRGEQPQVMHFAQINQRDGFFIAAREPDDNFTWGKLIGKDVLVDHFFQPLAMFKYAVHKQGVDFDQIRVIDAGDIAAMDKAFRDGQGDYIHLQGPAPQQLEFDGIGHVVACVGDAVGPVAFSSLCATPEWLQTDMAKTFIEAYKQAKRAACEWDAEEIGSKLQQAKFFTDIDKTVLSQTIKAYQNLNTWHGGIDIAPETYENLLDVFEYNGLIKKRHKIKINRD